MPQESLEQAYSGLNDEYSKLDERFEAIYNILTKNEGGIEKRLDEHRELVEKLSADSKGLLDSTPWVIGWLKSQDDFLEAIYQQITAKRFPKKAPRKKPDYDTIGK